MTKFNQIIIVTFRPLQCHFKGSVFAGKKNLRNIFLLFKQAEKKPHSNLNRQNQKMVI